MKFLRAIWLCLTCALAMPLSATAGQWHTTAGLAGKHLRFDEISPQGSRLVREQGLMPGFTLSGRYTEAAWDVALTGAIYSGEIDYDGRTQGGQPLESDTEETFYELDVLARYRLPGPTQPLSLYLVASADARLWQRRIQGTATAQGLDEDYRWQRLGAGAACAYRTPVAGTFSVQARVIRSVQPQVEVDFDSFDDATLNLKQRYGWRLDAGWSRMLAASSELSIAAFLEYWEFGRSDSETLSSNGTPVGTLFQPQAEAREAGVRMELVHHW